MPEYEQKPLSARWMHYAHRDYNVDQDSLTRVDRDPCFYCGTRGDMGCRHRSQK